MSDEHLRAKLVDAGHDKSHIELTDREELLDLFANLLVQTQARVSVYEPPAPAMDDNLPAANRVCGDPGLEREMFEFDKRKWDAEERYREFEMKIGMMSGKSVELSRESVIGNGRLRKGGRTPSGRRVIGNGKPSGKTARLR